MRKCTNKFFRLLFILLVLYGTGMFCYGQQPEVKFNHLTTANGLSQSTITGIVKDKYGLMWFGTWSGLCRYDGYRFKVYRYAKGKANSLINSRIYNVVLDDKKDLWVLTFDETVLCRYRYETDDFERIPLKNVSAALKKQINRNQHLSNLAVDYKGYRWDLDLIKKDLFQTNITTGKVKRYAPNPVNQWAINDSFATDLYLDDQHMLWVGTFSNGINKANLDAKPFSYYYHDPNNSNSIIDNNVHAIAEDNQGNLWVGTRDKGVTMITKTGNYRHFRQTGGADGIGNNYIKTIFCDSRGYVWIGTRRGLEGFDPKTGKLRHYLAATVGTNHVFGITEDYLGQIWFASWDGIYKYLPKKDLLIRQKVQGLPSRLAMTIMEDAAHKLWIGTEGGGVGIFEAIGDENLKRIDLFTQASTGKKSLSDDKVYSLYQDSKQRIWIGTGNGLDLFDPRSRNFKHFNVSSNGLISAYITGIVEDDRGFIWASHAKGVSKINNQSLEIRNYATQDGLQGEDFSDATIYKSPKTGKLYLGGNNGFNVFHPDSIKIDSSTAKVVLTELQILNRPVGVNDTINGRVLLHTPLYLSKEINLNHLDRSMAIEFAALHFANPSANKYAYMLSGFDAKWIYTDASNRIAVYSNLPRGRYTFKVKAANSDGFWTKVHTTLTITVSPAWYASTLAYICYAIVGLALFYAFYRNSLRLQLLKNKLAYESLLHEKERELYQDKIDFFTNISHEIKMPLSLILAPIERLMTMEKVNQLANAQLQTMKNSGDRLLRLINQLLDMRRFETGNDQLKLENQEAVGFLRRIIATFDEVAKTRKISYAFESAVQVLNCRFDGDKIEKVMYNLLSNAFKFTPDGGSINIHLLINEGQGSESIVVEVANTGVNIEEADFELIFKPFQQAGGHQKGGTGLGLAYSKSLAELHGGSISVKSNATSAGEGVTAFTLKLPLIASLAGNAVALKNDKENFAVTTVAEQPIHQTTHHSETVILIVEDDHELRNYLVSFFGDQYQVLQAVNGKEGLSMAKDRVPDLVISDMTMPEMDGLELCQQLKSELATSHIPIVLLTARTPIEFQLKGAENGADDYVTKPFNLQLLSLKVKNLLKVRAVLQEKYKGKTVFQPSTSTPLSKDEELLKRILSLVTDQISNPELDITEVCNSVGLGRTQLYRKVKALTGLTMIEIIRDIRLERAKQLLSGGKFNVNEVCYMVGLNDVDHFRKVFKAHVGKSPSTYAKESREP